MKRLLCVIVVVIAGAPHSSDVSAQTKYHAIVYGYSSPSAIQWLPVANGDSLGTVTYQGHEIPTTKDFPPVAYSCTDTWYQHAGQRIGTYSGICTMVDDDGDWYRFFFSQPSPDAWEGPQSCFDGTGKYEGIKCEANYRGTSATGPGWFRGEKEGTFVLK